MTPTASQLSELRWTGSGSEVEMRRMMLVAAAAAMLTVGLAAPKADARPSHRAPRQAWVPTHVMMDGTVIPGYFRAMRRAGLVWVQGHHRVNRWISGSWMTKAERRHMLRAERRAERRAAALRAERRAQRRAAAQAERRAQRRAQRQAAARTERRQERRQDRAEERRGDRRSQPAARRGSQRGSQRSQSHGSSGRRS